MNAALIEAFKGADSSTFPDFHIYTNPLERGAWILWVAKEKLQRPALSAEEISEIAIDCMEVSLDSISITNAFTRSMGKVHIHKNEGKPRFEIMKAGKDHLLSFVKAGSVDVVYFEPGKKFTARMLSKGLFDAGTDEFKIVDPYCGMRALGLLAHLKQPVKFLTQLSKLSPKDKKDLLQNLPDFKSEHPNIEIRDYSASDLHDRYLISAGKFIMLGHSIKDLGSKESFAVTFQREAAKNLLESVEETFNRRWNTSAAV